MTVALVVDSVLLAFTAWGVQKETADNFKMLLNHLMPLDGIESTAEINEKWFAIEGV